MAGDAP